MTYDQLLPAELMGSKELWVQVRLLVTEAPNSSYTTAQFARGTSANTNRTFEVKLDYDGVTEILSGTSPQFNSTNSFGGTVGVAFSNTVTASGTTPIIFGGANLPTGLSISTNGLINGTPTVAGTNAATLTASNSIGSTNQTTTFIIAKGTPVLTWTPSPITSLTYPAALSSTQLNATSSVAGTFSYNPTNGTVLNVGTSTLVATFTPSNTTNYTSGLTITNTVVVAKGTQNIIFGALPIKYVGDAAFNLTASAGSGLTVTYASSNTNVATVLGSLVTIVGEGTTTITASQAGNSNWNAAMSVPQTLTVQSALNRGLVAYYPFNGNVNDESGNARHATNSTANTQFLSGTELKVTTDNSYYYGSGGHVLLPNFSGSISNLATVSFWVRDETLLEGDGEAYIAFGEVLS